MRSGLSSAAAPDAPLEALISGALRHGLAALELRAGDAHGVSGVLAARHGAAREAVQLAEAARVAIAGYRDTGRDDEEALVGLSRELGSPLLVDASTDLEERLARAVRLRESGAAVAVVVRGSTAAADAVVVAHRGLSVAWDADPAQGPLGATASQLLAHCSAALTHVRLLGGGPESVMHEGRGVGELMARLALSGFGGAVILAPSSTRFHVAWATWLGRRGGWGCGSHASDPSLVSLDSPPVAGDAA
ncbi:MAG: hypothetical protein ABS52_06230 [Gemmatimonadetes bacterium SCN 70-22]|nr:MAG: hypothetical protein ABS52_06230 [Gemmatimonadetes bacterium SCN 70-22]